MNRLVTLIALLLTTIIVAIVPTQAQISIQLGAGVGVLSPASDFRGTTLEYYAGQNYGLSSGFAVAGKARLGVLGFNLVGEISYASLSNEGNSEPGQGRVEVSQKILTLRAGPEFQLSLPAIPLTPYVGASVALHRFSGQTTFQGVAKVPSATFDVESASRIGVGLNGGVLVKLGPSLSLDLGVGYNLMNVAGKTWADVNPTQEQRLDSYLALNDGKDPLYRAGDDKHFITNERSISSIQAMASIMFGL
jgi:opacity protein-like surface antigen